MKYFRHRYYRALEERTVQLINGGAEVLFPHGTYQLARLGLVLREPAPSNAGVSVSNAANRRGVDSHVRLVAETDCQARLQNQ